MSQSKGTGSWRVSALQGHGDPGGLGTVPTAAWSIPCWSPYHWQGCQLRDFLCFEYNQPERNPIRFHLHQKVAFLHFISEFGSENKVSSKLRPGFAPQTPSPSRMLQGCSSAGTAGSAWKLSLLRSGECFPGVTGAIRAFEGNFLCDTWLRNKV